MDIFCDFCGAQFDTQKNSTCPNCGGAFSHDSEVKSASEKQKKLDELDVRNREMDLKEREAKLEQQKAEHDIKKIRKNSKTTVVFIGVIAVIMLALMIFMMSGVAGTDAAAVIFRQMEPALSILNL